MPTPAFALRLWGCVWLLVSALSALVQALGHDWPLLLRTFAISALMVPTMLYAIIPALKRGERAARSLPSQEPLP